MNVVGYRLIIGKNLFDRSKCVHCNQTVAWYDLIPIASYFILRGSCRSCKQPISPLYPFIELLCTITLFALYKAIPSQNFIAYFIFFSALIVTIRSDLETMLISRWVTLYLIPIGCIASYYGYIPIDFQTSILSALGGFCGLYVFAYLFKIIRKKDGIGQGDIDLIGFIGSFTGPFGIWASLLIGSLLGSIVGIGYMIVTKQNTTARIPFGPFLAFGAIMFVLFKNYLIQIIL